MQIERLIFVAALEGIHKDRKSLISHFCPVNALLETSTGVCTNEQESQKIKDKARSNSQHKVRQVLFAQVHCIRIIIHTWVAMDTIHVVNVDWG